MKPKSPYVHTRQLVCHWTPLNLSEHGAWETQCGDAFWLEVSNPKGNNMNFCPYCGGALIQEDSIDESD